MAPIIDDSKGPKDPIDLAAASAASGAVSVAAADTAVSHLSLGGFCLVSFVKRAGLLVKADTKLGFVRYYLCIVTSSHVPQFVLPAHPHNMY